MVRLVPAIRSTRQIGVKAVPTAERLIWLKRLALENDHQSQGNPWR